VTGRVAHGRPFIFGFQTLRGIPLENVVSRMGMIFFSLDAGGNGTPPAIRYERIETAVQ
jgi:hypothetical protein